MGTLGEVLAALVPSVGVGLLFFLAIRALVNADRNERAALARLEAQEREEMASEGKTPSST
jgi:hypothetical protein